jgi:hypothetical protein
MDDDDESFCLVGLLFILFVHYCSLLYEKIHGAHQDGHHSGYSSSFEFDCDITERRRLLTINNLTCVIMCHRPFSKELEKPNSMRLVI